MSEVSVKDLRGMLISLLNNFIQISVFTTYILTTSMEVNRYLNITIFSIGLMYAVLGILFVNCLFYESPYLLVQQNREQEAIQNMMKLRNESIETWEIKNDFQEMKTMIEEDNQINSNIFRDGNLRPLILISLSSLISVLSFNYGINQIRIYLTMTNSEVQVSAIVYLLLRTTLGIIVILFIDKFRRRALQTFTGIGAGILLIISGILVMCVNSIEGQIAVFCIYEAFVILGAGTITDVLSSEAFPLTKKVNSLAFRFDIESVLNIIFIAATLNIRLTETYMTAMLITTGVLMIICSVFLWLQLPETRLMSLRQARAEFRQRDGVLYSGNNKPMGIIN